MKKTEAPLPDNKQQPDRQQDAHAAAGGAAPARYKFRILCDREAKWTEARYWKDMAIGHAWIQVEDPTGANDSWGYWPDLWSGHAVDPKQPWKSVPGKVLHPDTKHDPNAQHSYDIDHPTAEKITKAANDKEASPGSYNLLSYNCTNFAIEMAHQAGVAAPSFSILGIGNPNSLFAGIEKLNKKQGEDPMEHRLAATAAGTP